MAAISNTGISPIGSSLLGLHPCVAALAGYDARDIGLFPTIWHRDAFTTRRLIDTEQTTILVTDPISDLPLADKS